MNEFLSIFITWQFLVLCIGIAAVTFVFRTIIEFVILDNPRMPGNRTSKFWRDVVLVILPILLGATFAIVDTSFPYPAVISESYSKFLFSSSAGLLSPTLYRVIKALLWKNTTVVNDRPAPFYFPTDPNVQVIDPVTQTDPITGLVQSVIVNIKPPTADDVNKEPSEPSEPFEPKV